MGNSEVFVQIEGNLGKHVLEIPPQGSTLHLVEAALSTGMISPHEAWAVYLEDDDGDGLADHIEIDVQRNLQGECFHIGKAKQKIEVTVHFNGGSFVHEFTPATKIQRVFDRAVNFFGIVPGQASEMTLQVCNVTERPNHDVHIGTLIKNHERKLCFDLVVKVANQGC